MTTGRERYGEDFGAAQMWGLQEPPLPEQVAWLPLTPGWFLVGVLLLAGLSWWGYRRYLVWRRDAWRRKAIAAIAAGERDAARLAVLPHLLRRTALAVAPRREVASLRGERWIEWLNQRAGRTVFRPGDAARLDGLVFGYPDASKDNIELAERCLAWLRGRHARV